MLFKNTAGQKALVYAYNKTTGVPVTGDAANITATVSKDGGGAAASNDTNPTEIGAGWYVFDLTAGETNCDLFLLAASSATSNILVNGVAGYTTGGSIPAAGVASQASLDSVSSAVDVVDSLVSNLPTASAIATAVWASGTRTLSSFGSLVSDIWAAVVDSSGVTTLLSRLTSGRAGNLDNLDAAITTRLATAGYTGPDNASITAIKAKTDLIPAAPAAVGDVPTANQNADALLDRSGAIETGWTLRKALRVVLSAAGGKLSGAATTTVSIRDVVDTKTRISATVDADGNRTAVTLDGD